MISFFESPKPKQLFEPGGEPQLHAVSLAAYHGNDHTRYAAHQHEDKLEIILVTQGEYMRLCGRRRLFVQRGDLVIHNPGVLHDENMVCGNTAGYCTLIKQLQLVGSPVNQLLPNGESPVLHTGEHFGELETLVKMMHAALYRRQTGYAESAAALCRTYIILIVGLLEERRAGIPSGRDVEPIQKEESESFLCERAQTYIDEHYTESLALQDLSAAMQVSPSYLSHVFKRTTGFSLMQYTTHRRIGEAQERLVCTQEGITEIAMKVGFETPNSFYKTFVKQVGMSPSRFRKLYRESAFFPAGCNIP